MSTTLTIRNLAEPVKQMLRLRAAGHGRSMEAEARAILTEALEGPGPPPPRDRAEMLERLAALSGIWRGKGSTDELMKELRGED
jgi:antitoxin FitA